MPATRQPHRDRVSECELTAAFEQAADGVQERVDCGADKENAVEPEDNGLKMPEAHIESLLKSVVRVGCRRSGNQARYEQCKRAHAGIHQQVDSVKDYRERPGGQAKRDAEPRDAKRGDH
jgi:hypothetical protein